ncbi:D-glucuronyl C5-epimerase family protein [Pseudomonas danubii]|uniref:D-glucuronyl C5-epimerase family protein n=1 Tax=Pseudomonas danubii TaxID=2497146 RepID=UPI003857E323
MSFTSSRIISIVFYAITALYASIILAESDNTQTNVDQAQHFTNERGVPILAIDGVGKVTHPAWAALYALAYAGVEDYDPSLGIKPDEKYFESTISWLKENLTQNQQGLWVWPYNFDSTYNDVAIKAPWSSAFAQATGIQALLVHWKKTGDQNSLSLAKKAAESLFTPLSKGGFLFTQNDDIWFEEIPNSSKNPSHILNGNMRALLAVEELAKATKDPTYEKWLSQGLATLERWLPLYDNGYSLRYDLNPKKDELLFRLANPYGFANPNIAIDRIILRDPKSGKQSILDIGAPGDAEGDLRIAGNDWEQSEQVAGRTTRRLKSAIGGREKPGSEGEMVAPYTYFYLKLPSEWQDNLRQESFELIVDYLDEKPGNLEVQMRSIAPGTSSFRGLKDGNLLLSGSGKWREWKIALEPQSLGYWVGETYAKKHYEYLKALSSHKPFEPWAKLAKAYLHAASKNLKYTVVSPPTVKLPDQTPVLPWYSMDSKGVLLMHIKDNDDPKGLGKAVYSPFIVASQAIDGSNMGGLAAILKKFEISPDSVKKEAAISWILDPKNQDLLGNGTLYNFNFRNVYNDVVTPSPWPSSFAQTYITKALLSSLKNKDTNKNLINSTLKRVLTSYSLELGKGGIAHIDRQGNYFFEEVPNRTHVLNAQLSAVPAINEAADYLNDQHARKTLQKGISSLKTNLHSFDTGYWMRYDLNPKKELLFQFDWLEGTASPLIEEIALESPQSLKAIRLQVGSDKAFESPSHITGLEWMPAIKEDGRITRPFANGYKKHGSAVQGGTRHNVYALMQLPDTNFSDYLDIQPHRLTIRYKDTSAGTFIVKIQSINEGNVLDFTPLHNAVITTVGDQKWKDAVIEVRPQDMGWYKGSDYQIFEIQQLDLISKLTGDWFFSQFEERQRYFLDSKEKSQPVIITPSAEDDDSQPIELSVVSSSPTYEGFDFTNALDNDPNDDYVAGEENSAENFVILKSKYPFKKGTLKIRWEGPSNYAGLVTLSQVNSNMLTKKIMDTNVSSGAPLNIEINSESALDTIRLDFSKFVGQPRILMRLIELNATPLHNGKVVKEEVQPDKSLFLSGTDLKNPLHVFRIPISNQVKNLSDELAKGAANDHEKVEKFMDYISGFSVGVAENAGPDATIEQKIGACGSFTNTLLALAAAQGLQGRVVSLLNYPMNDGHAVAEIKIAGKWHLYDPTYDVFYTRKNSEAPLSFLEIKSLYLSGQEVTVHKGNERAGADRFTGREIFVNANPAGAIGPDKPMVFPLRLSATEKNEITKADFGPTRQGASHIGAADTNQMQSWTLEDLKPGEKYRFSIQPKYLAGEFEESDANFELYAIIDEKNQSQITHNFKFTNGKTPPFNLDFVATATSATVMLSHPYRGPSYHYLSMESYKLSAIGIKK